MQGFTAQQEINTVFLRANLQKLCLCIESINLQFANNNVLSLPTEDSLCSISYKPLSLTKFKHYFKLPTPLCHLRKAFLATRKIKAIPLLLMSLLMYFLT